MSHPATVLLPARFSAGNLKAEQGNRVTKKKPESVEPSGF
jgi:hypothetical protein